jgi:Xaa-Pro aminopeptidase
VAPVPTAARLNRLRAALAEQGVDALLVSEPHNRRYLSGFTGSAGHLLITGDAAQIATDFRYWEQAAAECVGYTVFQAGGQLAAWFGEWVRPLGRRRLGFEAAGVSYDLYRVLRDRIAALPPGDRPELVPLSGTVEALRAIKEPEEIAALERVVALADAAFAAVAERVEPGWTEQAVAWAIEQEVRTRGGEGLSFPTIVAGGPWGAMPHARPRDVPLQQGEAVVIDMGALLAGYCSDMTRTLALGAPDGRFTAVYDIVFTAQRAAVEMIEAGMTGDTAHRLAHDVIEAAGYGERFGHGLGHGIGLQVHESPWLRRDSTDVLRDGMVFSIEPGIYLPGWGGVRIEDLVVLEHGRCRVLTASAK